MEGRGQILSLVPSVSAGHSQADAPTQAQAHDLQDYTDSLTAESQRAADAAICPSFDNLPLSSHHGWEMTEHGERKAGERSQVIRSSRCSLPY